jgi:hypothetical protein
MGFRRGINELRCDAQLGRCLAHAAFEHITHPQFATDLLYVYRPTLYVKLELRAITNNCRKRDNAVMISSTMPSAKYSCSGSPLTFWNGSTAIEGLSGSAKAGRELGFAGARPPQDVLQMVEPEVEARPRRLAIERHSEIARIRRLRGSVVHRMRLEQWHS